MNNVLGALALVLSVVTIGGLIGPDYAYLGTYYSLVAAHAALAFLLWPARHIPIARGTFFLSICLTCMLAYFAIHVTFGRPIWFIKGTPFLIFLGFAGGLLASVCYLIISIGVIHERTAFYVSAVSAIIAASFGLSWFLS